MIAVLLGLLVSASTFAVAWTLVGPQSSGALRRRVAAHVEPVNRARPHDGRRVRTHVETLLLDTEQMLAGRRAWRVVERKIERAGVGLRAVEVAYAALAGGLFVGLALVVTTGSPAGFLIGLALAVAATWTFLGVRAGRRLRAFDAQLPDLLITLAAALRAGHGLAQALEATADDVEEPARGELALVIAEARLGRPLEYALARMAERMPSMDLEFVLTAVTIQRQVGGSLAELLDVVIETVRRRQHFALKLRALTSTGRTSASVLIALPVALGALLTLLNRDYMAPLYTTSAGQVLLGGAVVMVLAGAAMLKRIVTVKG